MSEFGAFSKDFDNLSPDDKHRLFDALLSMMNMSASIANEHGFLVYRVGDLTFEIHTPEKIIQVAKFMHDNREWNTSIDPPKTLRWSRTVYSKSGNPATLNMPVSMSDAKLTITHTSNCPLKEA